MLRESLARRLHGPAAWEASGRQLGKHPATELWLTEWLGSLAQTPVSVLLSAENASLALGSEESPRDPFLGWLRQAPPSLPRRACPPWTLPTAKMAARGAAARSRPARLGSAPPCPARPRPALPGRARLGGWRLARPRDAFKRAARAPRAGRTARRGRAGDQVTANPRRRRRAPVTAPPAGTRDVGHGIWDRGHGIRDWGPGTQRRGAREWGSPGSAARGAGDGRRARGPGRVRRSLRGGGTDPRCGRRGGGTWPVPRVFGTLCGLAVSPRLRVWPAGGGEQPERPESRPARVAAPACGSGRGHLRSRTPVLALRCVSSKPRETTPAQPWR